MQCAVDSLNSEAHERSSREIVVTLQQRGMVPEMVQCTNCKLCPSGCSTRRGCTFGIIHCLGSTFPFFELLRRHQVQLCVFSLLASHLTGFHREFWVLWNRLLVTCNFSCRWESIVTCASFCFDNTKGSVHIPCSIG
jgi:hypothetical protein